MPSYSYGFCYKQQYNQSFDLITSCSFDGGFDQVSSFTAVEGITSYKYDGTMIDYGARYAEKVELQITMVKKNYTPLSLQEKRKILAWLTSSKQCSWLTLYDEHGEEVVDFYGRFNHVEEKIADSRVIGLIATFVSPYPYGFSPLRQIKQSFYGKEKLTIQNDSDVLDDYVRPYIAVKLNRNVDVLTIANHTTNTIVYVKNIKSGETITLDCENKLAFSNDSYRKMGSDFYGNINGYTTNYPVFVEFSPGDNEIEIDTGNSLCKCEYTIQYRYPVKAGSTF